MAAARRTSAPQRLSAEERAAKVDALMDQLAGAVGELTDGEQWTAMLRAATKFHRYSFRNMMLLWAQAEERGMPLTAVAGFGTWRSLGRWVRKGEKGLAVLAPITRRVGDDPTPGADDGSGGRVICGVRVAHVFDLAQTDGEPIPEPPRPTWLSGEDAPGLWDSLATLVAAEGYTLQRNAEGGGTQGWTRYTDRVVSVRPDVGGAHASAVLAHELGHVRSGHEHRDISRAQKETEAESIAYVVMTGCGLDSATSAVPYVAGWSGRRRRRDRGRRGDGAQGGVRDPGRSRPTC